MRACLLIVASLAACRGPGHVQETPDAPIVAFVPSDKEELKPGAAIFVAAAKPQHDGTLQAPRIGVGRGVAPPM